MIQMCLRHIMILIIMQLIEHTCCTRHVNDKEGKGAKPLIGVRNETFGGSSQILKTSGHRKKRGLDIVEVSPTSSHM